MVACPKCGVELGENMKFCGECGTKLEPPAEKKVMTKVGGAKCMVCNGTGKCVFKPGHLGCDGSKKCKVCGGMGKLTNCFHCKGTGVCQLCNGTGKCADCNGKGMV